MIIEYAGLHYQALNPCKKQKIFYDLCKTCKCLKKENTHAIVNLYVMSTTKVISLSISLCKRQECFLLPLQYFYVCRVFSYYRVRAFSAVFWFMSFSLSAQLCPSCQGFSAYGIFCFYCNFRVSSSLVALGPVYSLMFGSLLVLVFRPYLAIVL